jgi:hypothetical protein
MVPAPVVFNCLKHHLGYIQEFVRDIVVTNSTTTLHTPLLTIGESQMDLYLGAMAPAQIAYQIIELLQQRGILNKLAYRAFINKQQAGYHTITLSDTSVWVLRLGEVGNRHIHIHPGRYSPHTIRVKASTLKTAVALSIWMKQHGYTEATIEVLNYVRKDILETSPVKSLGVTEGFGKIFRLVHAEK